MKRYMLFAGSQYYPSGGWDDFKDSFDTCEEALVAARLQETGYKGKTKPVYDWFHVVDVQGFIIVATDAVVY